MAFEFARGRMTLELLRQRRAEIVGVAAIHGASNVRVFGSVIRRETTPASDLDLLVKARPGCSLFDLGGLLEDLQDMLACRVDLVVEDGLKAQRS